MKSLFRVRTVTVFLSLNPIDFAPSSPASPSPQEGSGLFHKMNEAAMLLQRMEVMLTEAGYEVQTLRIATNPFGEWMLPGDEGDTPPLAGTASTAHLSPDDLNIAQTRLQQLNERLTHHKIGFCALGPARTVAEIACCPWIVETGGSLSCSADIQANDVSMAQAAASCVIEIAQLPGLEGLGNFRFCATAANNKAFIPFFPAAKSASFLAKTKAKNGIVGFALGLENGKLAQDLLKKTGTMSKIPTVFRDGMAEALAPVQDICQRAAQTLGYTFLGIDTSLNPSLEDNGSVAEAMECLTEVPCFGGPGTVGAAAAITTALQSLPGILMTGYCGLMLPVCEDQRLAALAVHQQSSSSSGRRLSISDLLSVSSVCGVGIDTVPLAGDVSVERLASLFLDMTGLAARWDKSLSCRVLPFTGKQVGDRTDFDSPYMVNTDVFLL